MSTTYIINKRMAIQYIAGKLPNRKSIYKGRIHMAYANDAKAIQFMITAKRAVSADELKPLINFKRHWFREHIDLVNRLLYAEVIKEVRPG